ncbi:MAG: hypothetical protein EOO38_21565 [Cytophagaceae bacterium]|nr:MAG: hypothetical protein EOO38_21565 [Cytophagaceae bacterium]
MSAPIAYDDVPPRYITSAAINSINALLGISEDQYSQDWEFEISDSDRLPEYLDIYENKLTTEDERFAMMAVIIDAFERSDLDPNLWGRIRKHLQTEFALHQTTILYWCVVDEEVYDPEIGNWWTITPRMRDLWKECRSKRG